MAVQYINMHLPWQVYPRVAIFQKRFTELLPRFKGLIEAGKFKSPDIYEEDIWKAIGNMDSVFKRNLHVHVIAHPDDIKDFEPKRYICDLQPLKPNQQHLGAGPLLVKNDVNIYIYYVKADRYDEACKKDILGSCQHYFIHLHPGCLFFQIDVPGLTATERDKLQSYIIRHPSYPMQQFCYGNEGQLLPYRISFYLESKLMQGFHKARNYLKKFTDATPKKLNTSFDMCTNLEERFTVNNLFLLLCDLFQSREQTTAQASAELKMKANEEEDVNVEKLLDNIVHALRCHVVSLLPEKYKLPVRICNLVLVESNFEDKLNIYLNQIRDKDFKVAAKRAKVSMMQLRDSAQQEWKMENSLVKLHKKILKQVRFTISEEFAGADKDLAFAERVTGIMRKMVIEIEGYLQDTVTDEKLCVKRHRPTVDREMRKKLLELKCVHSVATVYHEFEIHLYDDGEEKMDTDDSAVASKKDEHIASPLDAAVKEIDKILMKYNFRDPYNVRVIAEKPKHLVRHVYEHGSPIRVIHSSGTLGCFQENGRAELLGVTCAHVIGTNDAGQVVEINRNGEEWRVFARTCPEYIIRTAEIPSMPLIDIAALRVDDEAKPNCVLELKDEFGRFCSYILFDNETTDIRDSIEQPDELVGKVVFKYGAATGFTKGIVASVDASVTVNTGDYLIMIDELPAIDAQTFASKGDSGAVVCLTVLEDEINSQHDRPVLMAVSMISHGKMTLKDKLYEEITLSFNLKKGLDKLKERFQ